ncbi:hypothetical protein KVR01_009169 [Diaporthe batatas]|uniref:uncharacterized protein n=1 Tax=Diaporthe batatas TaxID=748121 RepID=UPI001D05BF5E|nr:uncharacterized protein KVR01_009169 [Diaporthe batatas]KAG8160905.1 hypothetical protein KVR01_009169 [Diaporthe batatas]
MQLRIQSNTQPWPAADKGGYDLVHQRLGLFAAGDMLHTAVAGLVELVKPGGWIQLVDSDLTGPESAPENPLSASMRLIKGILNKAPGDAYAADLKNIFKQHGLVAVQEKAVDVRMGALNPNIELAKKSTTSFCLATEGMVEVARGVPTALSPEDLDGIIPKMKKELEATGAILRYWVVWVRSHFSSF